MPNRASEASTDTCVDHTSSGSATAVATPSRSAQRPMKPSTLPPRASAPEAPPAAAAAGPRTNGVRTAVSTPAYNIISAAARPSSQSRPSSSARRPRVTGSLASTRSSSPSGSGRRSASAPCAPPSQGTRRPRGTPSQTPFGAPRRAAPAIRLGCGSPTAAYTAAASPARTATRRTVTIADTAGRTTRCIQSSPGGRGVRREASRAMSSTPRHQVRPPSTVGTVSTVKPTSASVAARSPSRSGSRPPPRSPRSPSPGISMSSRSPPPGSCSSMPRRLPSRVMTAFPARASPHIRTTNSASTAPARARSSPAGTTTPVPRKERRKNQDSRRAPTRLTPSGVISMAVVAWAPSRPITDTSPDGVTDPPAPSATTAAVMGPSWPAASASSRCRPSAAAPAMPINAQLTAAIAENTTSPHGTRLPWSTYRSLMVGPPDPHRGVAPLMSPSRGITTLRPGFNPVNGTGRCPPTFSSQGPTFGQGVEPEIVPPDVRHP